MNEIREMERQYYNWLMEETIFTNYGEWVGIASPMLDRNNDYIEFFVKKQDNEIIISDHGETISELLMLGIDVKNNEKYAKFLKLTLNGFGIELFNNMELRIIANPKNYNEKKHSIVQAILAINDLYVLDNQKSKRPNFFIENVLKWFDDNDIGVNRNINITGKSGFQFKCDLIIPPSRKKNKPEKIIKILNRLNKTQVVNLIFGWEDIKKFREDNTELYTIIGANDNDSNANAFKQYGILPIEFDNIENNRNLFIA